MIKLVPFLVLAFGMVSGLLIGANLKPVYNLEASTQIDKSAESKEISTSNDSEEETEFVKLNNQFIVPVTDGNSIKSLVVVSIGLEIAQNETGAVFSMEPKLRDSLLQVLFDHANVGGFDADFTASRNMVFLREALTASAQDVLGSTVINVLITDLARQDV